VIFCIEAWFFGAFPVFDRTQLRVPHYLSIGARALVDIARARPGLNGSTLEMRNAHRRYRPREMRVPCDSAVEPNSAGRDRANDRSRANLCTPDIDAETLLSPDQRGRA
jgi:hypothetical protein